VVEAKQSFMAETAVFARAAAWTVPAGLLSVLNIRTHP
jgi:hypothetical protein